MKIKRNVYKEDGKKRVEYLVEDRDGLIAVFQRQSEAEKFVALVKEQQRARQC